MKTQPSPLIPTAIAIFSLLFIPAMMILNSALEEKPSELSLAIERANSEADAYHREAVKPVVLVPMFKVKKLSPAEARRVFWANSKNHDAAILALYGKEGE